tara:strand:+ start:943 stop:1110 length:168 start_codon:yes stop_codon:yes gene_type:complete
MPGRKSDAGGATNNARQVASTCELIRKSGFCSASGVKMKNMRRDVQNLCRSAVSS